MLIYGNSAALWVYKLSQCHFYINKNGLFLCKLGVLSFESYSQNSTLFISTINGARSEVALSELHKRANPFVNQALKQGRQKTHFILSEFPHVLLNMCTLKVKRKLNSLKLIGNVPVDYHLVGENSSSVWHFYTFEHWQHIIFTEN